MGAVRKRRRFWSPPTRGRGSKLLIRPDSLQQRCRPPRGGVGRNITTWPRGTIQYSRPPRGGVGRNVYNKDKPEKRRRSPPTRGRGSKRSMPVSRPLLGVSPPTRGRGSKPLLQPVDDAFMRVAPHAGAWVETRKCQSRISDPTVAPHAGAWVETRSPRRPPRDAGGRPPRGGVGRNHALAFSAFRSTSPPTRGRGSKHVDREPPAGCRVVAPHAGAWVETRPTDRQPVPSTRRPPRGGVGRNDMLVRRRPAEVVAPHAGAWVETAYRIRLHQQAWVAPHAGAWVETLSSTLMASLGCRRPPRGGVGRNSLIPRLWLRALGRPPRGGVGRNR